MGERVWQIPPEQFAAAWNAAASLADVVERVKQLASGNVPRWAVMARPAALRKEGVALKELRAA
jgi:hypothetical protein